MTHSIRVPEAWLASGATIELDLPRTLSCANCNGGGCDACQRAGAISIRERDESARPLQVALPTRHADSEGQAVVLRIPETGGHSEIAHVPRGLLLLKVTVGPEADPGVRLLSASRERELRAPAPVVIRSLLLATLLLLLFLWMLRLSGWL